VPALCGRIHLTLIERDVEGDTLFPEYAAAEWREVAREAGVSAADGALRFSFVTLGACSGQPGLLPSEGAATCFQQDIDLP